MDVHYEVDGPADGPAVVLSNSIGSNLRMWQPQVKPLVDSGFRVIRYDTRGHGRSPVPAAPYTIADLGGDVVALLDRLGISSAHFVGLSLGGMTGIWLAQHEPARIAGLAATFTSARTAGNAQMWRDRIAQVRESGMGVIADGSVGRWFTQPWIDAHPALAKEMREMTAATPVEGYAGCCEVLATLDLVPGLAKITAPTLVISGAEDKSLPPEQGRQIADNVTGARFELISPAAHLGSYEQPERFNELVIAHLKGVS
ncbi:3-oxoadipate enol-lactonase [Amycolatopsis sp. K13G38]|uniref:3-oxoadipate enol-lactonase n=1 Tax=Amycolatopsis acididurans TaxID=2724524 RepID=A0ABX1J2Z3_9PSEU|nr:3-oxoadipate enol-lactonase [Amycolatopsis acididurans]NKQ54137.1 3-oxoadipate enol-lactonase [Amycolatopsis acididurans]